MKTGIGQSKYCTPQPFSRCLISLCSSLFDLNCIFYQLLINNEDIFVLMFCCINYNYLSILGVCLNVAGRESRVEVAGAGAGKGRG